MSTGVTALVATPFLHAGTGWFIQARRVRQLALDGRVRAQLVLLPTGFAVVW